MGEKSADQKASGSLGLLAMYSDSDSEDDAVDKVSGKVVSQEKLAVPTSIQKMFEAGPSKSTEHEKQELRIPQFTGEDNKLGYFEVFSSDDEIHDNTASTSCRMRLKLAT